MNRLNSSLIAFTGLMILILLVTAPALGDGSSRKLGQTWPSRTPTSASPPQPTNPLATEPPPQQTTVATPGATLLPTLEPPAPGTSPGAGQLTPPTAPGSGASTGGSGELLPPELELIQLPSAADVGDCGLPPLAVALGPVNVRSGPGIDFEIVADLAFQDERPIVGRASTAAWWQLLLPDLRLGWVSDQAVAVVGYTGAVPIRAADQGEADGPHWNPTPNPACTPPSTEEIAIIDGQLAAILAASSTPPAPDSAATPESDGVSVNEETQTPEFSPLAPDGAEGGFDMIWLPIIGGLLILAGGFALLLQRRQG